jgi:uncharacterized protein (TIGR02594 family)
MKFVARVAAGLVMIAAAAPTAASANNAMDYYNQPEVRKAMGVRGTPQMRNTPSVRRSASRQAARAANPSQPARRVARPFASASNPHWISVARQYKGTNPTGRKSLWCADFMNLVLNRSGLKGTSSSTARSFAGYGQRLSGPKVGAIAVLSRGKNGGHVGIVTGVSPDGNLTILSGNHNNRVAEANYSRGRVIAYVWPTS